MTVWRLGDYFTNQTDKCPSWTDALTTPPRPPGADDPFWRDFHPEEPSPVRTSPFRTTGHPQSFPMPAGGPE
jgi:hypothetical protein